MTRPDTQKPVGLFGLGLIGSAIASRLVGAGVDVRGYDPDQYAMARLEELGGHAVQPEDVWDAPLVFSAVFDTDQLFDLVSQAPAGNGKVLVSLSTCDPQRMPEIAEVAFEKRWHLLEAPISGTSADLANGKAVLLVAGDQGTAESLEPVFNLLARAHFYVGAVGNGNRAKLAVNLVLGLCRAAVAEGIVFAEAIGLDPEDFLDLALDSAAYSKVMASKGPKMVSRDFSPLGRISQSAKDFHLIRDQATQAGQGLPMTEQYLEIISRSIGAGEGGLDNSAILLEIARTTVGREQ